VLETLGLKLTLCGESVDQAWVLVALLVAEYHGRCLPRQRIAAVHSLSHVVELIRSRKKILVLSGSGISASAGVPDFRAGNGIYRMIEEQFPELPERQSLFDINYFVRNPQPFLLFTKKLFPGNFKPTACHFFIRELERRGQLLRTYTQNIDTLEHVAGIEKTVHCHGSFATASCVACRHQVPGDAIKAQVLAEEVPRCSKCTHELNILKPDVTFFGQPLGHAFEQRVREDVQAVDLLLVLGSALNAQPMASIPPSLPRDVPQVLLNGESLGGAHAFDAELLGDCDGIVHWLARALGWQLPPAGSTDGETADDATEAAAAQSLPEPTLQPPNRHIFPVAAPAAADGVTGLQLPVAESSGPAGSC